MFYLNLFHVGIYLYPVFICNSLIAECKQLGFTPLVQNSNNLAWQGNSSSVSIISPLTQVSLIDIPVVIHIISESSSAGNKPPFPTDSQIRDGIDWINNLLSGGSACPDDPTSIETHFRLCLASRDLYGNLTTGIDRFSDSLTDMDECTEDLSLKQLPRQPIDRFPGTDYLNIYLVREICASCQPGGCLAGGYASFPGSHGKAEDGIVLEAFTWMNTDCDFRKVVLHELGHYLNLRHTWEGGCKNDNCISDGDLVCDTPPDTDNNFYPSNGCIQAMPVNSCFSDVNLLDPLNPFNLDQPDMTSNLMDYAPPKCIAIFTEGQATRMLDAINGPRKSLLESKGCQAPCPDPISFSVDWPVDQILYGYPINIPNNTIGAVSFIWTWYGGTVTTKDFTFTPDSVGAFEICLEAIGASPECTVTLCHTIQVVCSQVSPLFNLSDVQLENGDPLLMTQTSLVENGYQYHWYINGVSVGSGSPFQFTPQSDGSSTVWLEACRSGCCEQSSHQYFNVGICPTGKEANHWIFADDSIHLEWNGTNFIEQPPAGAGTFEASAIANDANGQLLFYTNGRKVYNRQNQVMPNGNLMIDASSSTQKITVPLPGSDSLWYLFIPMSSDIVSPLGDTTTKLLMSLVDMSLDGGNGDVILKNQNILQPTTEKVVASHHCNGIDWWIVGHEAGSNRFFSWLLSKNGLQSPIQSNLGIVKPNDRSTKAGELQFSPDGLKLAMITGPSYFKSKDTSWTVEILDFDPLTGIISNNNLLGEFPGEHPHSETYGLEFSPNNHFLYVARAAWIDTLMQFDITLPSIEEIRNSRKDVYIATVPVDDALFGLLTGPDSKIYIANYLEPYLGVIENPNESGENVIYNNKGLVFNRGMSSLGLPNFPNGIYHPGKPWIKGPRYICDTIQEVKYYISGNCHYQDYDWRVTGNSSIIRMLGDTVWLHPLHPGQEQLTVQKFSACGITTDTIYITIDSCMIEYSPCTINFTWGEVDTVVCKGEDAWFTYFSQADHASIELNHDGIWQPVSGSLLSIPQPDQDLLVSLLLTSDLGCDTVIEVPIHVNPPIDFQITNLDTLVCLGDSAIIDLIAIPTNLIEIFSKDLNWVITNPSFPLKFGPVNTDTTIYVRIRNSQMSCDSVFIWDILVDSSSSMVTDTSWICIGDSILILGTWVKAEGISDEIIPQIGCDSLHRSVVRFYPQISADYYIQNPCEGATGSIEISMKNGEPPFLYSINGGLPQASPKFGNLAEGNFLISISDKFGCQFDTVVVLAEGSGVGNWGVELTQPSCDLNNGTVLLKAEAAGIQFSLNNVPFSTNAVYSNLAAGSYYAIALHPAGCLDTIDFSLIQSGKPTFEEFLAVDPHCGQNDGSILISNVTGGIAPFQFKLGSSPYDTSHFFQELAAGSYTLFVLDSTLCEIDSVITLNAISGPIIENIQVNPALCGFPIGSIEVTTNPTDGLLYKINEEPAISLPYFSSLLPGYYQITVSDSFKCITEADVVVPDSFSFKINLIDVKAAQCQKDNGEILITTSSPVTITVSELPGKLFSNLIDNLPDGLYHIHVQDDLNCYVDTTVQVNMLCDIYLPNVFSPNADGINDVFGIVDNVSMSQWKLQIFDRSGNMVFESNDPLNGWNGQFYNQPAQSGVYAWKLEYVFYNDPIRKYKKGDLTLIR